MKGTTARVDAPFRILLRELEIVEISSRHLGL